MAVVCMTMTCYIMDIRKKDSSNTHPGLFDYFDSYYVAASHPVISNDRQHLRLCSECQNGVCTPFRSSDISVCCHSSSAFCGPGSSVELDGLLARDCSKLPCSQGYECSLAPSGGRVCCSLAECPNGQRARSVCAAGCRRDEKCELIHGQRWCCPALTQKCPDGRVR
ncbi:unnamed protein product [Strongylus vulgaris]|uniref:EB domain-containing protein n=1 Tax=Strongylus vulgaris TaxID=40348 RepID=A0A3P7JL13_STRVU|nr:unnamed protein product [Strongylus vulgaris]